MKFDGNLAWKQASATIAAHRHLLLALAGVFFFLPSFAMIMLVKQPQMAPGATAEQMAAALEPFIASMAPWFLIGSIVQALGQLTLMALFGDNGHATVGEALRRGLSALPSYIVVQLLTGFMMVSVLVLAMALGGIVSPVLGVLVGVYAVILAYARFVPAGAVVVLERQLNPFTALVRAVALTRGNGFRLGNFLALLAVAALFVLAVLSIVLGIIATVTIGSGRAAEIVTGFVTSAASAFALAYFVAIVVAIYRQLSGTAAERVSLPSE